MAAGQINTAGFGKVTATYSSLTSPRVPLRVGELRVLNDRTYEFQQADDAVTVNQAVTYDIAASATCSKVTPTGTTGSDLVIGVGETALTDEYYGFITKKGIASCLVETGVAAGDLLASGSTAGVLAKFIPRARVIMRHDFNAAGTLADGTTYSALLCPGVASVVKAIGLSAITPTAGGTNTFAAKRGSSSGNTMLSAATYDPTGLTANQLTAMTLSSTAADLALAASGANSGVHCAYVCGTQGTDGVGVAVTVEVEPTQIHKICAIALVANSSGSDAARNVYLL